MSGNKLPSVPAQVLSGALWVAAAVALAACLSERYRPDFAVDFPTPPVAADAETTSGPETDDSAEPVATVVQIAPPVQKWHRPTGRRGIYIPPPSLRVPVEIACEPLTVNPFPGQLLLR